MPTTDEKVDHPKHYNAHPAGIECIDVVEHFTFNLGNAVKYIWRNGLKSGATAVEDLKKARWYIEHEIQRLEKEAAKHLSFHLAGYECPTHGAVDTACCEGARRVEASSEDIAKEAAKQGRAT